MNKKNPSDLGWGGLVPAADRVVENAYDYQNRWVRRRLDADGDGHTDQRRIFAYDGNQIVLDFWRNNSQDLQIGHLRQRYLWGPAVDQILAEEAVDDGTADLVQWTLTDHLNTVRDIAKYDPGTDMTTVVNHLVYDAFGRVSSESNPAVDSLFLFTAPPFDPDTGLQNILNRWYDASVGRWLSEDPIGFAGGNENLYQYVSSEPASGLDSDGLLRWSGSTRYWIKARTVDRRVWHWGRFAISINWLIVPRPVRPPRPTGLPESSWLIQHVVATFDVWRNGEHVRHPADDGRWDYWEAWLVLPGSASPLQRVLRDDTFAMPSAEPGTCGTIIMRGVAQFYPNQNLPTQFQPDNPATHAGRLPATTDASAVTALVPMSFAPLTREVVATWRPDVQRGRTQLRYSVSYQPLPDLGFPGEVA